MPICINVTTYTAVAWLLMVKPCSCLHRLYCSAVLDPPYTTLSGKCAGAHLNNMKRALDSFLSWVTESLIQVWGKRGREMKTHR